VYPARLGSPTVKSMSVARHLASRLRELRQQRGWTQQELADRANLSLNAINSYERAERFPRAESLDAILLALEVGPARAPELLSLDDGGTPEGWPSAERRRAFAALHAVLEGQSVEFVRLVADLARRLAAHLHRG
jgi:transcriptional regulator with XRE-family HTH domain